MAPVRLKSFAQISIYHLNDPHQRSGRDIKYPALSKRENFALRNSLRREKAFQLRETHGLLRKPEVLLISSPVLRL